MLIADADRPALELARALVERAGYESRIAADAATAFALLEYERPDLALVELRMPGLGGMGFARHARALRGGDWFPVIACTGAAADADAVVLAVADAGFEDFLRKPLRYETLRARLDTFRRLLDRHRTLATRGAELAADRRAARDEQRLARHLIDRLTRDDPTVPSHVSSWIQSADTLSGDVVASVGRPGGGYHLLYADVAGHGLAAAVAGLPAVEVFYRMSGEGCRIEAVAAEMNRKVRSYAPRERFVAAVLAGVDPASGQVSIWNGGCPDVLLIDAPGNALHRFRSRHLALGILDCTGFDPTVETMPYLDGSELLLLSDGVLETEGPQGERLTEQALLAHTPGGSREARFEALKRCVYRHCAATPAADDLSVVLASLPGPAGG